MNEMDVLKYFYDETVLRGVTRDQVFLSLEKDAAEIISARMGQTVPVTQLQELADVCIANEWLERTTADPNFKYLSMTEAGLQMFLASQYH